MNLFQLLPSVLCHNYLLSAKWAPTNRLKKSYPKRHDRVDAKYRKVYRKWSGTPYKGVHPTHIPIGSNDIIPAKQKVPSYCLLCPITTTFPSMCHLKRHFQHLHVKYTITVDKTTMLACKCSQIKSQGTDGSCHNLHYHCHICHWPRIQKHQMFIHFTSQHNLTMSQVGHLMRKPKLARDMM